MRSVDEIHEFFDITISCRGVDLLSTMTMMCQEAATDMKYIDPVYGMKKCLAALNENVEMEKVG